MPETSSDSSFEDVGSQANVDPSVGANPATDGSSPTSAGSSILSEFPAGARACAGLGVVLFIENGERRLRRGGE